MKPWIALLLLGAILTGCAGGSQRFPLLTEDSGDSGRRILVTFIDRSINRPALANPSDPYQPRGLYSNSGWSERVATSLARRHGLRLLAQWPVTTLGVACVVYEIPANQSVDQTLSILTHDQQVGSVQTMRDYRVLHAPNGAMLQYNDPYLDMQHGVKSSAIAKAHRFTTGKGVRIAVIDTGVDINHPDLTGHVSTSTNLAPLTTGTDTADVHGTAVAGVLAAQPNNGIGIVGIAPGAEIMSLRACWPATTGAAAARCNSYTLALALNEAIRLHADIINMSLTGPDDPLVGKLVEAAVNHGIVIVAAVPEDGHPGGFPANMPGVLAVASAAATRQASTDRLFAPGQDVLTTVPHGAYNFMNGSSFAAPHIAGVIALLRQLQPQLATKDLRAMLTNPNLRTPLEAVSILTQ